MGIINDVCVTPLKIIYGKSGDILHALKSTENSYSSFGEAYFSTVDKMAIKGWKNHRKMLLNIIVPSGAIRFVLYDDRKESKTYGIVQEVILSKENYQRLTIPAGIWMAFQGLSDDVNMLLNIASIVHDPEEAENLPVQNDRIPYQWIA